MCVFAKLKILNYVGMTADGCVDVFTGIQARGFCVFVQIVKYYVEMGWHVLIDVYLNSEKCGD